MAGRRTELKVESTQIPEKAFAHQADLARDLGDLKCKVSQVLQ
jgi:hypothetical protein